ncbi:trypsin-like peptidase domain-containing protein [Tundrisphaera lichenicola]|uniref:trypsin-like peptidase domain-containing protein n=1 Tax=Tundrisphaera lichenicola TaxID=2029860 RepID=UPI003EBAA4D2
MPNLAPLILAFLALSDNPQPPAAAMDVVSALESTLADAIARAEPSVVAIARDKDGKSEETTAIRGRNPAPQVVPQPPTPFGGFRGLEDLETRDYISTDYGSGVVIGDKGEILTTFHVVKGASLLLVRAQGVKEFEAEVIAADPRSDLAVIVPRTIPGQSPPRLKPIAMGDASKLRKGSFLLSLGNPFNAGRDGQASASWGILSNISRRLDLPTAQLEPYKKQLRNYPTLLQLDAKLNLGMSGGAVVDLKGELVGLTTNAANAGGFDAQAGYALPIDTLSRRAIEALRQGKEVEYGFLGVRLPPDNTNKIREVEPGTPAGEGGLQLGDEIVSIGGINVVDSDTLVMAVNAFSPGAPIKLRIIREGQALEKTVVLSKLRVYGEVIATNRPMDWRGIRVDFVSTDPRAVNGQDLLEAMAMGGVVIAEVQPGSPGEAAGLKAGQIIVKVGEKAVKNPEDFAKAVTDSKGPVEVTTEGNRVITVP